MRNFNTPQNLNYNGSCKGVKNNTNFGQITGIQEQLDTSRKYKCL